MPVDKGRLPSQPKASFTVGQHGLAREIGIPSVFPKHLTERSVTWQRGGSDPLARRDPHRAVRILADALKRDSFKLKVRSDGPAFQMNDLMPPTTQSPPAWSARMLPIVLLETIGRRMPRTETERRRTCKYRREEIRTRENRPKFA